MPSLRPGQPLGRPTTFGMAARTWLAGLVSAVATGYPLLGVPAPLLVFAAGLGPVGTPARPLAAVTGPGTLGRPTASSVPTATPALSLATPALLAGPGAALSPLSGALAAGLRRGSATRATSGRPLGPSLAGLWLRPTADATALLRPGLARL